MNKATSVDPNLWLELHGNALFAYAMSVLRDRELAEDVVQETFLSALKHLEQHRGGGTEVDILSSVKLNEGCPGSEFA